MMTLGEKIARLRRENHYTQEQLAHILSVSRQSISKWELDTAFPETDKLIRLSSLFDVSLDYLLKDTTAIPSVCPQVADALDYSGWLGAWCRIALKDWDSGYNQAALIGQDGVYLAFYQTDRRKTIKYGVVRKDLIDTVAKISLTPKKQSGLPALPEVLPYLSDWLQPFVGKVCDIQLHSPNFTAFILSDDGYQQALITAIDNQFVFIKDGETSVMLRREAIAGIVES